MVAGELFVFSKTRESKKIVDAWASCAMLNSCIAPLGSKLVCDKAKIQSGKYANCHRFDQSVLNILLYKCVPQLEKVYRKSDLIRVCREGVCAKSAL